MLAYTELTDSWATCVMLIGDTTLYKPILPRDKQKSLRNGLQHK